MAPHPPPRFLSPPTAPPPSNPRPPIDTPRAILHVDMDAFFAAIEIRDNPALRGKPVVVGAPPDRRGVVSTASYEARRFGIHSAMPSSQAGQLCPHAVFLRPDMRKYAAVSRQVIEIFGSFTPFVEQVSVDEAFLDVSGATRLFGPPPEIAAKIKAAIREKLRLTCSVGVARNKFLAKLGSEFRKPDGLTVIPFDDAELLPFLRPLPVSSIWGVGGATAKILDRAGIRSFGDLQDRPLPALAALLGGKTARHLRDLAFGRDERPLEFGVPEKSISREYTFLHDTRDPAEIADVLFRLVEDVAARLRADGRSAATARLKFRYRGFESHTRQMPLDPPTVLGADLHAAAKELLSALDPERPLRLVGFGVSNLLEPGVPRQLALFDDAPADAPYRERTERFERAADAIRTRHGPSSLRPARSLPPPPAPES